MPYWDYRSTYWGKDIFKSEPYETGGIARTFHETLDPYHLNICPHCHGNSATLQREVSDLYCFACGWRDSFYFNKRLNGFIVWVKGREKKYGAPILLSDSEQKEADTKAQELAKLKMWDKEHQDRRREIAKLYRQRYPEKEKEKRRRHYLRHKEEALEYNRAYRATHREECRELSRNYKLRIRALKKQEVMV